MFDQLLLHYISPKGKKYYWIGQVLLGIGILIFLFSIRNLPLLRNRGMLLIVFVFLFFIVTIAWGMLCSLIWSAKRAAKTKTKKEENSLVN
ncbi:DUF2207 domain-containing protein [Zophobihabitans entericus]|uniref:DUF2207 domain-containing protein n=1 Tax=Zophobihabitans entericus TaxID=1635327 RepID=A0A6G9I9K7_9GAMM|nr:DUF2207 domain-containing protein [Zophobihabitans entericus]QIQ20414.1 DUF2207 domain-containing protein [Zophobihabitans entericus]